MIFVFYFTKESREFTLWLISLVVYHYKEKVSESSHLLVLLAVTKEMALVLPLPMSDAKTDALPEEEYDAVFVSGKNKTPHGRVRSADAFDSHDLVLFRVTPNYKTDNPGEVARDDYDEPFISNYQFNFIQQSKSGDVGNEDNIVRILVDPAESERLQAGLKPGDKLVPQGLKFAFAGNDATDWTVYADTLVSFHQEQPVCQHQIKVRQLNKTDKNK